MKHLRSAYVIIIGSALALLTAMPVFAQSGQKTLQNPLKFTSIEKFIEGALQAMVMIALPIISVFIIWAGFMFIKARGNSTELGKAKENLKYVLIGATLILSAWVLATLIGATVTQLIR